MSSAQTRVGDEHAELAELLPWYANSTLDDEQRARINAHAAVCAECARELTFLKGLADGMEAEESLFLNPERSFSSLAQRIDALEAELGWGDIARVVRTKLSGEWVLPTAACATLFLVAWLWLGLSAPNFRTLSAPNEPPVSEQSVIRLVFDESTSVGELQELLHRLDLELVGGPSAYGVLTAHTASDRLDEIVEELRQDPRVSFAEPIPGAPEPLRGKAEVKP